MPNYKDYSTFAFPSSMNTMDPTHLAKFSVSNLFPRHLIKTFRWTPHCQVIKNFKNNLNYPNQRSLPGTFKGKWLKTLLGELSVYSTCARSECYAPRDHGLFQVNDGAENVTVSIYFLMFVFRTALKTVFRALRSWPCNGSGTPCAT